MINGDLVNLGGGGGLPSVTSSDNGKVLGVVGGAWGKMNPNMYVDLSLLTPNVTSNLYTAIEAIVQDITSDPADGGEASPVYSAYPPSSGNSFSAFTEAVNDLVINGKIPIFPLSDIFPDGSYCIVRIADTKTGYGAAFEGTFTYKPSEGSHNHFISLSFLVYENLVLAIGNLISFLNE